MVLTNIVRRIGPLYSIEVMWSNPYEKEVKKNSGYNADSVLVDTFDSLS